MTNPAFCNPKALTRDLHRAPPFIEARLLPKPTDRLSPYSLAANVRVAALHDGDLRPAAEQGGASASSSCWEISSLTAASPVARALPPGARHPQFNFPTFLFPVRPSLVSLRTQNP